MTYFSWRCNEPQRARRNDWLPAAPVDAEPLPRLERPSGSPPGELHRQVVSDADLARLPFKAAGQLRYFKPNGQRFAGTGFVVNLGGAQDVIMTAAHCVTVPGGWNDRFCFAPAQHLQGGHDVLPHGWWTVERVWASGPALDLALCRTTTPLEMDPKPPVGQVVGRLDVERTPARSHQTSWLSLGYPASPPADDGAQQSCRGTWSKDEGAAHMLMANTMESGASGGPWVSSHDPGPNGPATGINSRGAGGEMLSRIFDDDVIGDLQEIAGRLAQPCPA